MKNEKGTIVLAGGVIGLIAAILVFFGNPANMGEFASPFTTGYNSRASKRVRAAATTYYERSLE